MLVAMSEHPSGIENAKLLYGLGGGLARLGADAGETARSAQALYDHLLSNHDDFINANMATWNMIVGLKTKGDDKSYATALVYLKWLAAKADREDTASAKASKPAAATSTAPSSFPNPFTDLFSGEKGVLPSTSNTPAAPSTTATTGPSPIDYINAIVKGGVDVYTAIKPPKQATGSAATNAMIAKLAAQQNQKGKAKAGTDFTTWALVGGGVLLLGVIAAIALSASRK